MRSGPIADPARRKERIALEGELPSPINPPRGCAFHPRCPLAFDRCRVERPELEEKGGVKVACFAVDAAGRVAPPVAAVAGPPH
jgi:dipeptide transport system ATP-binding protein